MQTSPCDFLASLPPFGKAEWPAKNRREGRVVAGGRRRCHNLLLRSMGPSVFFPPGDGGGLQFHGCPASLSNSSYKVCIRPPIIPCLGLARAPVVAGEWRCLLSRRTTAVANNIHLKESETTIQIWGPT
jgi:hypothetical protein